MSKVSEYLQKIGAFFSDIVAYTQRIWEWTASSQRYRILFLAVCAVLALMLVRLLIGLLRKGKKGKGDLVFGVLFVLAVYCCGVWVCGRQLSRTQPPEPVALQTESGEEALACERYSLAYGRMIPSNGPSVMDCCWQLEDDTVGWKIADDAILQITGIHTLCEDRDYRVDSLWQENGAAFVGLSDLDLVRFPNGTNDSRSEWLIVAVYPNRQLQKQSWYRQTGASFTSENVIDRSAEAEYVILENSGDAVTFCMRNAVMGMHAACMARQMGDDVVVAASWARSNYWRSSGATVETPEYDPVENEADRAFLAAPLESLFDGRICVLHGLSADTAARILPDRIATCPRQFSPLLIFKGNFSAPCGELLELRGETAARGMPGEYSMKWIGKGPDGKDVLYTVVNGGSWMTYLGDDEHSTLLKQWNDAYADGGKDPAMTKFLEIRTVAFGDGWLLSPGPYLGANAGDTMLYYLTMEPYEP